MLLLALSCLQGRTQSGAARELMDLGPDGLQLTPGNAPSDDLDAALTLAPVVRAHHGFTRSALRTRTWTPDTDCTQRSPQSRHGLPFSAMVPRMWLCGGGGEERNG